MMRFIPWVKNIEDIEQVIKTYMYTKHWYHKTNSMHTLYGMGDKQFTCKTPTKIRGIGIGGHRGQAPLNF